MSQSAARDGRFHPPCQLWDSGQQKDKSVRRHTVDRICRRTLRSICRKDEDKRGESTGGTTNWIPFSGHSSVPKSTPALFMAQLSLISFASRMMSWAYFCLPFASSFL